MSQLEFIFTEVNFKLPNDRTKLSKKQKDSIMNFTTQRLLGKPYKSKRK